MASSSDQRWTCLEMIQKDDAESLKKVLSEIEASQSQQHLLEASDKFLVRFDFRCVVLFMSTFLSQSCMLVTKGIQTIIVSPRGCSQTTGYRRGGGGQEELE